jgi:hypothetical protein
MKLFEITFTNGQTTTLASMTYDEELSLATSVVQALTKHWLTPDSRKISSKLYAIGTGGSSPRVEDLQKYLDMRIVWVENLEDVGRAEDAPSNPHFVCDDTTMCAPKSTRGGETSIEWKAQWYAEQRRLAWREAWSNNKKALCSYSNLYRVFPGDSNDELESQELAQIQPFFDYVRAVMKSNRWPLDQAIREAMGHIPCAELSLEDLHELYPDYPAK